MQGEQFGLEARAGRDILHRLVFIAIGIHPADVMDIARPAFGDIVAKGHLEHFCRIGLFSFRQAERDPHQAEGVLGDIGEIRS